MADSVLAGMVCCRSGLAHQHNFDPSDNRQWAFGLRCNLRPVQRLT
jgi:hypothetical protein